MWQENSHVYSNDAGQEVRLFFRRTDSSDWKYDDRVFEHIYDVKLATQWGNQFFWYCFAGEEFPTADRCDIYLSAEHLAFEALLPYLRGDISAGLNLGAVLPHLNFGVLVFGRAH